jgi:copper(I)-binding protein
MNPCVVRRRLLWAGMGSGALLVAPAVQACEFFATRLRVWHPWARASAEGARDTVLFMSFDDVQRDERLVALHTPVAEAVRMADGRSPVDVLIPAGRPTVLDEAGPHLRLVGLQHPLGLGRSYPLTLVFASGETVRATLNVDQPAAGGPGPALPAFATRPGAARP